MSRSMILVLFLLGSFIPTSLVYAAIQQEPTVNIQFIVDQSGSMAGQTDTNEYRIDSAQTVLREVVSQIPQSDNLNVGLRVYGHLGNNQEAGKEESCQSTELLVPMSGLDKEQLNANIDSLQPVGWTPIGLALSEAEKDFTTPADDNVTNTIILLTDGLETCGEDPAAIAESLQTSELGITTNVIGFGTTADEQRILERIAQSGGGQLLSSNNSGQLMSALFQVLEQMDIVEESGSGDSESEAVLQGRQGTVGDYEIVVTGQSQSADNVTGGINTTINLTITYQGPQVGNPSDFLQFMFLGQTGIQYDLGSYGCSNAHESMDSRLFTGASVATSFCVTVHPDDADLLVVGVSPQTSAEGMTWFATTSSVPTLELQPSTFYMIETYDSFTYEPDQLTIPANTDVSITVTNNGFMQHTFAIEGTNVEISHLNHGESASVIVNLPPGTYHFYCMVAGHQQSGMTGTLSVVED